MYIDPPPEWKTNKVPNTPAQVRAECRRIYRRPKDAAICTVVNVSLNCLNSPILWSNPYLRLDKIIGRIMVESAALALELLLHGMYNHLELAHLDSFCHDQNLTVLFRLKVLRKQSIHAIENPKALMQSKSYLAMPFSAQLYIPYHNWL